MSKNLDAVIRYRVINSCLLSKTHKYPTREELREKCIEALGVNDLGIRTIEKDLNEMRYNESLGYLAPILFDKKEKGYYYEDSNYSIDNLTIGEDEMEAIKLASSILQQFKGTHFLSSLKGTIDRLFDVLKVRDFEESKAQDEFIQFDHSDYVPGGEYLEQLVGHISNRNELELYYQKFGTDTFKKYTFQPYCLKEFQGFWFVLGRVEAYDAIRTFALDRIQQFLTTDETFNKPDFDVKEYFNSIYGVSEGNGEKKNIVLEFNVIQGNYIKALPIHPSQKIMEETKDKVVVSLDLTPNLELQMKILSYGRSVRVIKPEGLSLQIQLLLQESLQQYN
jgi:predicted DNA-binding transcriptional regulator YafY